MRLAHPKLMTIPSCYCSPKTIASERAGVGRCLLAAEDIEHGELVAAFGGRAVLASELRSLSDRERRLMIQVDERLYLSSENEGPADWINHSCDPNTGLEGPIVLVALRRISRGEELCFDYAMADGSPYDEFQCQCGSALCRGWVSGDDWRRLDLQERYRGHFSPYLARRMAAL